MLRRVSYVPRFIGVVAVLLAASNAGAGTIYTTTNYGTHLAQINTSTGASTMIGAFGVGSTYGNAFDLDGTLYATTNSSTLARINLTTGAATILGALPTQMYAIDFDPLGNLYGFGWNGGLYRLSESNGSGVLVGFSGVLSMMDISFDAFGKLYGTVGGRLYTFNTSTGTVTSNIAIVGLASPGDIMGLMFDEANVLYATAHINSSPLYTINVSTGLATPVAATTGLNGPHGGDIYVAAVPESGAAGAVLAGIFALTVAALSRRGSL
jgi:hypothetical protein